MTTSFNIKRISALALLLAFFMPLSQCSAPQEENSNKAAEVLVKYAYSHNAASPLTISAVVAAFFWPILISVIFTFNALLRSSLLLKLLELLFCLGTGYLLVVINIFGTPLYGSYVATLAISFYGLLTLHEIVAIIRNKKHNKSLNQIGARDAPPG